MIQLNLNAPRPTLLADLEVLDDNDHRRSNAHRRMPRAQNKPKSPDQMHMLVS